MSGLPRRTQLHLILRSFMIQSSWNSRTMLGHGFGFALRPALWWRYDTDEEREAALARHVEHFNAHPYLVPLGLGAVARIEVDGVDPHRIRDFKTAVRGPLGAIGDRLIWVGWLPTISLAALAFALLGARPAWVALAFLAVYNAGHIALRLWGWSVGYRHGTEVAGAIRRARLQQQSEMLGRSAAVLLGVILGLVMVRGARAGFSAWLPLGALLFFAGNRARVRGWKPTLSITAVFIGTLAIFGALLN